MHRTSTRSVAPRSRLRMRKLRTYARLAAGLLLCAWLLPAAAHHSRSMFDDTRATTLSGTVRVFQWTNPHCYIQLLVPDANGARQEWSLEMGAPVYLYNLGWRPGTLQAGDVVRVKILPLRKGGRAGLVLEATSADGKPFGKGL